jgi:hypothetical protein
MTGLADKEQAFLGPVLFGGMSTARACLAGVVSVYRRARIVRRSDTIALLLSYWQSVSLS